ncbi:MAG TPA: ABC transporter permease [Paenirhodobacter sp.]
MSSFDGALGAAILALALVGAVFAAWISPQNPYDMASLSVLDSLMPPGSTAMNGMVMHLGSDEMGRDVFSAMLYGLRISLFVAVTATGIALIIGTIAGLTAAYAGGRVDAALMRLVDLQLSFPSMLIALVLMAAFGTGLDKVIVAIIASQWAYFARTIRGSAVIERRKEYIQAAQVLGYSRLRIVAVHLLPNSIGPLAVVATVEMAGAISLEATLSFLGLGLPVTQPSLGLLISNGFSLLITGQYWAAIFPGLLLMLLLVGFNLFGERLRKLTERSA